MNYLNLLMLKMDQHWCIQWLFAWRHQATTWMNINSLRPRLNRRPFADGIFKCIFLNENEWIWPRISLKFVPKVQINNIAALVQIMAWRRLGDKPLSEPMMVSLLTHICVTRPHQWGRLVFSGEPFHKNCSKYHSLQSVWCLKIT